MKRIDLWFIGLLLSVSGSAQTVLTAEQAVAELLQNNFEVRLAENSVELAGVNADKANVGLYPLIQMNGGINGDYGGARQSFQNGDQIEASANLQQTYNASVGLNYNLYQGGERQLELDRLFEEVDRMELQKQLTIETQMTELLTRYYQAAEAVEQYRLQEELVVFSEERLERAETNLEYGRGSSLDVTNAEVDLQRDKANLINARMMRDQSLRELLLFMGRTEAEVQIRVETEVDYSLVLSRQDLIAEAMKRNLQLSLVDADRALLSYDEQIVESQRKPTVSFNTEYGYRFQDFGQGGFFAQQRSNGLGAGINVAWDLYDGGRNKRQRQALEVQMQGNKLRRDQQELQLRSQLLNLYDNYQAALELNNVEKQSIEASKSAFERTREEYNLGRLGQIEFRQAQINLRNAQLAERQAAFNAKIMELQIAQLAGLLRDERYKY